MSSTELPPSAALDNEKSQTEVPTKPRRKNIWGGKSGRFWIAFFMLNLTAFISALDAVIIAAALPAIASDLRGTSNQAFWSGTAFLLAATITQPLYGTFSEIFGRRSNLIASLALFLVGSILCARSTYMGMFIGSRVVRETPCILKLIEDSRNWRRRNDCFSGSHCYRYGRTGRTWGICWHCFLGLGLWNSPWPHSWRRYCRTYYLEMVRSHPTFLMSGSSTLIFQ